MATMNVQTVLEAIKTSLVDVPGVATCKIGIEPNMTPEAYPIIRVVPSKVTRAKETWRRTLEIVVYFGAALQDFDGLESVYAELLRIEDEIVTRLMIGNHYHIKHTDTIMDEDRLTTYKLSAARFEVTLA